MTAPSAAIIDFDNRMRALVWRWKGEVQQSRRIVDYADHVERRINKTSGWQVATSIIDEPSETDRAALKELLTLWLPKLTVEYTVLTALCSALFSPEQRTKARRRLVEHPVEGTARLSRNELPLESDYGMDEWQ